MAVSADVPADREALEAKLALAFPVVSDTDLAIAASFGVRQEGRDSPVPATFILDADRRVLWSSVSDGIVDRPTIDQILAKLP